jgi:hypothetical protein
MIAFISISMMRRLVRQHVCDIDLLRTCTVVSDIDRLASSDISHSHHMSHPQQGTEWRSGPLLTGPNQESARHRSRLGSDFSESGRAFLILAEVGEIHKFKFQVVVSLATEQPPKTTAAFSMKS